jgi:hypothetical protein
LKSGTYIIIVIIGGFVLIGYLFFISPATAPTQLPLILAAVAALVAVLNKQGDTDQKVATSIAVSKENAQSIAAVSVQTGHALEDVGQKVDGHLTSLTDEIRALNQKVANLEKDKAVKIVEAQHLVSSTEKILNAIAAVAPQVVNEIVPPRDGEARVGDQH